MDMLGVFKDSKNARQLAPGEVLFREGDPCDSMYVVTSGELSVHSGGHPVDTVVAGGIIGEMAMIDERPRSATATATTETEVVPIDASWFKYLIRKNPEFALHVMATMAERLRRLVAQSTGSAEETFGSEVA